MEGLVWDPKDFNGPVPDLSTLPRGEISQVPQPSYIIIRSRGRLIPIKYCAAQLDKRNKKVKTTNYRTHLVDLLFAVTYHKLQGLNLDYLILSINKHPTAKLRLTLRSLYVGVSRVHDIDKLRVLPFWKEDVEYLTSLKRDPLLKLWYENYTEDGIWKGDGLQSFAAGVRNKELQRLALVDNLIFFTGEELKLYAKNLDLYVGSANKPEVIKILKPFYAEGRKLLSANGNRLLRLLRSELLLKLRQQGALGKLRITDLKSYAKRLGFDISQRTSRKNLERSLEKLMVDGVAGINLTPPSDIGGIVVDSESKLDVTPSEIKTQSGNVQSLTLKNSHGMQTVDFNDKELIQSPLPTIAQVIAAQEDEIKSHYYKEVQDKPKFKIFEIANDGNSLFRAFAHQLYGRQNEHRYIRNICCRYIELYGERFKLIIAAERNNVDLSHYLGSMRTLHTFGGNLEITALSEFYQRPVKIYPRHNVPWTTISHPADHVKGLLPIRITVDKGNHYCSIVSENHKKTVFITRDVFEGAAMFRHAMKVRHGYDIYKVKDDGNCLFSAFAHQIYGDANFHGIVRQKCCDYMALYRERFNAFIDTD